MKYFLMFVLIMNSLLVAAEKSESQKEKEKKHRMEKQIKKEMETEKKYAKEQTFYSEENYDFEGAEVNKDSLNSIPELEPQYDFNMDSVYD